MEKIPQIQPISTLKHQHKEVLQLLDNGPVVLTQYGQAIAVLVHPQEWDKAVDEREALEDIIASLQAELALADGNDELYEINPDNFVAEVMNEAVPS